LSDAKQHQIVDSASPVEPAGNLPLHCEMPDRPLSHVVVPWNAVLIKEAE
jgi:hypothetical protein